MTRLLLTAALAAAVGCTGIRPVGPLAKMAGPPPKSVPPKDRDGPDPSPVPAVKPTPPQNTVGFEDVTADDPQAAARRLTQELEADRKTITSGPVLVQTSRIKGGIKQE